MAKVREAIIGGFADSRVLQVHDQRMLERDFAPYGRMSIPLNDLRNVLATVKEIGFDAPVTQLFETLQRRHRARPGRARSISVVR